MESQYYVYWIVSGRSSYIGATTNPQKRLRQHCGIISGGANRTRGKLWKYKCVISGFRTWQEALCFEWGFKYYSKKCRCIDSRKSALIKFMGRERWTSNSPLSSEVPLSVEYDPIQYGFPPDTLPELKRIPPPFRNTTNTPFKKNLHGVKY